jgi:hypothetical protein
MDQNMDAGNTGTTAPSSTSESQSAPASNSQQSSQSNALAGGSFRDKILKFAQDKQEAKQRPVGDKPVNNANVPVESSEKSPSDSQSEMDAESVQDPSTDGQEQLLNSSEEHNTDSNKPKPWFQQRIDKLTAKYKSEQESHKQLALESAKKDAAIKILQEQLDRYAAHANIPLHEEEMERMRLDFKIKELDQQIPQEVEKTWSAKMQEMEIEEKTQELISTVKSAAQKYQGLVSEREIIAKMRELGEQNARVAAEKLYRERIAAAQKFIGTAPTAPMTAAGQPPVSARNNPTPERFKSSRDAFAAIQRERGGRLR